MVTVLFTMTGCQAEKESDMARIHVDEQYGFYMETADLRQRQINMYM